VFWWIKQRKIGWVAIFLREIWVICLSTIAKVFRRNMIKLLRLCMNVKQIGSIIRSQSLWWMNLIGWLKKLSMIVQPALWKAWNRESKKSLKEFNKILFVIRDLFPTTLKMRRVISKFLIMKNWKADRLSKIMCKASFLNSLILLKQMTKIVQGLILRLLLLEGQLILEKVKYLIKIHLLIDI